MTRHGRIALVALLLAILALPAAAQPTQSRDTDTGGLGRRLSALWTRLAAPFAALWGTEDGRGIWDPNGNPLPDSAFDPGTVDGRGIWNPDGLSAPGAR
jgi:hypothetical protein